MGRSLHERLVEIMYKYRPADPIRWTRTPETPRINRVKIMAIVKAMNLASVITKNKHYYRRDCERPPYVRVLRSSELALPAEREMVSTASNMIRLVNHDLLELV